MIYTAAIQILYNHTIRTCLSLPSPYFELQIRLILSYQITEKDTRTATVVHTAVAANCLMNTACSGGNRFLL